MIVFYLRILAVLFLSRGLALAADDAENVVIITPWHFYIVAIAIGILVSILLSRMARSSKVKIAAPEIREKIYDREFENSLEAQLTGVVASRENRSQIARSISGVVAEKMSRKISEVRSEAASKFEAAIKERDKEQEILHLKYKNVVAEKNQTEAIVQSLAEGLVVVNSKGEVVMMNPAAEKILGVSREQKVGKPLTQNLKGEEVVSLVSDASGEKTVELNATQMETKKIIRSSSALVENENGQTVGMVSVLTDITKQKELDQLKSQFVSTVSHELRTPIVAT